MQNKEAWRLVSVPALVPSVELQGGYSTLTLQLPMQGGCTFIVGRLLFYCELLPISFRFISFPVSIPAFITCLLYSTEESVSNVCLSYLDNGPWSLEFVMYSQVCNLLGGVCG